MSGATKMGSWPRREPLGSTSLNFSNAGRYNAGEPQAGLVAAASWPGPFLSKGIPVNETPLLVTFPGGEPAAACRVGAKAASLIEMAAAGLPVPRGGVLTTAFFAPLCERLQQTAAWRALAASGSDRWSGLCEEVQAAAVAVPFPAAHREALERVWQLLTEEFPGELLAVRSSSPDEDRVDASFAGCYQTRLGVTGDDLEQAVRACLAACFDARVLHYKKERGFDPFSSQLAVIVQRQLDARIAGVGFSLNPETNDYDEAVVEANWGLGESVVGGLSEPDHYVVDKVDRQIRARQRGGKRISIWLDARGGTYRREGHRPDEWTLSETRLSQLVTMICRVEELFGQPVDIEWCYSGDRPHLLQARPITTYVPLAPEMRTRPGERRRLYLDAGLAEGLASNAPLSPLGLDALREWLTGLSAAYGVPIDPDTPPEDALVLLRGCRTYLEMSNALRIPGHLQAFQKYDYMDTLLAETLAHIEIDTYRAVARPPWLRLAALGRLPRLLWELRQITWNTCWALLCPGRAADRYRRQREALEQALGEYNAGQLTLQAFREAAIPLTRRALDVTFGPVSAFFGALNALEWVVRPNSPEAREWCEDLKRGCPGNVVVEMGIAMARLAQTLQRSDFEDLPALAERLAQRQLPETFLSAWSAFLDRFGPRGPFEMDVASPRYGDDPQLLLRQLASMPGCESGFDPAAAQQRQIDARQRAFTELMRGAGPVRRLLLRRVHRILDLFAGSRDDVKHYLVHLNYPLRRRLLRQGRRWTDDGRLDHPDEIFDLTLSDVEKGVSDNTLELRAVARERSHFRRQLERQVAQFPHLIDSRGRILRPPVGDRTPGELRGKAISPGTAAGPVKLLHRPDDKRIDAGDILVAYTTDPGWTPLFASAAAVVLEVGGMLQHGAVVAREYGKPCVAGIEDVMNRLKEGQRVEVDGSQGVVRLLE